MWGLLSLLHRIVSAGSKSLHLGWRLPIRVGCCAVDTLNEGPSRRGLFAPDLAFALREQDARLQAGVVVSNEQDKCQTENGEEVEAGLLLILKRGDLLSGELKKLADLMQKNFRLKKLDSQIFFRVE